MLCSGMRSVRAITISARLLITLYRGYDARAIATMRTQRSRASLLLPGNAAATRRLGARTRFFSFRAFAAAAPFPHAIEYTRRDIDVASAPPRSRGEMLLLD